MWWKLAYPQWKLWTKDTIRVKSERGKSIKRLAIEVKIGKLKS